MTHPRLYLSRMLIFLLAVAAVVAVVGPALAEAFVANPALNGLILGVLLVGIVYSLRQVWLLRREVAWLEAYQTTGAASAPPHDAAATATPAPAPILLAPMARMLAGKRGRLSLSALSMRTLLDGIGYRLEESRELSRYLIGLLIFLGLLGTFWGLLHTVRSVGGVISGLSIATGDVAAMFANLQKGLEAPLTGMGQAFSASLFGLAGSLVLGFLELQASQAQNRFVMDMEDWLSGATRLSSGLGPPEGAEGSGTVSAYLQALMEQMADNLDHLRQIFLASEDGRRTTSHHLLALTERLTSLTEQMRAEQNLLHTLAESQMELRPVLSRLAEAAASGAFGMDEASRQHLRNLEVYVARLLEDMAVGRGQTVQELRAEIKMLARTISALAEDGDASR